MRQRSTQRRGTLVKRSLQIIASLALAGVGWVLLEDSEGLTAAETFPRGEDAANIVARFDGVAVTEEEVMAAAERELVELDRQRRQLISNTARQVVHQRLIAAEAESRGLTPEDLVATEGYDDLVSRLERKYRVEYMTGLDTLAMNRSAGPEDAGS